MSPYIIIKCLRRKKYKVDGVELNKEGEPLVEDAVQPFS